MNSQQLLGMKTVVRCADFERSRAFYAGVLGLRIVDEWTEEWGRGCIFSPLGDGCEGRLEIYQMSPADPRFHAAFAEPLPSDKVDLQLRAASVDAWVEWLRGKWAFANPCPGDSAGSSSAIQTGC